MKKILLGLSIILVIAIRGLAQNCTTGYCPKTITVDHYAGDISPLTVNITYEVVESTLSGDTACYIARNLGATAQADSATDATPEARGWFWQFNRKQGYSHDGTTRTPSVVNWITSISENGDWEAENDPCTLLLGIGWYIPTSAEWTNIDFNGGFATATNTWSSAFVIHAAGYLDTSTGALADAGVLGRYWTSTGNDNTTAIMYFANNISAGNAGVDSNPSNKAMGMTIRCMRTY